MSPTFLVLTKYTPSTGSWLAFGLHFIFRIWLFFCLLFSAVLGFEVSVLAELDMHSVTE